MSTSQPQMQEHARRSSGIYDQENPFAGGSEEGLADLLPNIFPAFSTFLTRFLDCPRDIERVY
ncbi:hypothetical protein M422DRAFT_249173 [Sphaerobolus stellatus SS14]|nr:hypothetical protein M422DRAFT_249173 [Sphaerobolus stellatus SS14]